MIYFLGWAQRSWAQKQWAKKDVIFHIIFFFLKISKIKGQHEVC
jgi:hypothetical protein